MKTNPQPRALLIAVALAVVSLGMLLGPGAASADRGLSLGVFDLSLQDLDPDQQDPWWDRASAARSDVAKLHLIWYGTVADKPQAPRNPNDPAYYFDHYDAAIRNAAARGIDVVVDVSGAPTWAEGSGDRDGAPKGTYKPSPKALADFMHALAKRYSGTAVDEQGQPLPRVEYFQVWNEPNIPAYLNPQWKGKSSFAASHYRKMLNAAYEAIKQANPQATVVTGGTSPYGDEPGGKRTRPLDFWRRVFQGRTDFDVLAHNPINTHGSPRASTRDPDDVSSADMGRLKKVLDRAERSGAAPGQHPLWAAEIWFPSKPPEPSGLSLAKQARFLQESMYLSWKAGVSTVIVYTLHDRPKRVYPWDGGGLYYKDGSPKPALAAFRFPLVADAKGKKTVIWGKAPTAGKVAIEYRKGKAGGWKRIATADAGSSRVFKISVRLKGKGKREIRATIDGAASLPWKL